MVLKSSTKGFSGGIVNFGKARLVLASKTSSYVELSSPDLTSSSNNNNNKCLFCEKSTNHDHDIIGKVKFDPKQKSYLVSLIEKKAQQVLDVIPINFTSNSTSGGDNLDDKVKKEPKTKFKHIFPESVTDESSAIQYFAKRLNRSTAVASSTKTSSSSSNVEISAAVKIENNESVLLLNSKPKSLLKNQSPNNCDKCLNADFDSLDELQNHYETAHHNAIEIRDISIREESAVNIQDGARSDRISGYPKRIASSGSNTVVNDEEEENVEFKLSDVELRGFKCQFCDSIFSNDKERIKHNNEIHVSASETKLQCPSCLQYFKNLSSFKKHRSEHFKEKVRKHNCHLCTKSFYKAAHLKAHTQMHMGAKLHSCEICDKRFSSQNAAKNHQINIHGVGKKPKCHICQKTFYNNTLAKKHILEFHEKDTRLECQYCGQYYLRKDNLDLHIQNVHEAGQKHPCKLCPKSYACKDRLQDHLRTVHGILPWNTVQILQTESKPHVSDHEKVQKELEGSVKCRYCEQVFLSTELEYHLRFSHGVKPIRPGTLASTSANELSISEAAEALLKTLTPQPDYLLRSLTPLPMETLDELIMDSALSKE